MLDSTVISDYKVVTYSRTKLLLPISIPQGHIVNRGRHITSLDQARNDSLAIANLILAKLLNVPPSSLQRTRQHGTDLIDQERPRRRTIPASNHPETQPLNPLTEVMRKQHIVEKPILGHHVKFLHTIDGLIVFLGSLLLAAKRRPADLA